MTQVNAISILDMFGHNRIPVICTEKEQREPLILSLVNSKAAEKVGLLRFNLPEPDQFKAFINGALHTLADAAGAVYERKYPGIVAVELDHEEYLRNENMLLAFLELLSLTTGMHAVIFCGSEKLMHRALCGASRFGVPGVLKLQDEADLSRTLVVQTAARLGVNFTGGEVLSQTVRLYDELSASPAFNAESFLRSVSVNGVVTKGALQSENESSCGYLRMCRELLSDKSRNSVGRSVSRRIGFQTHAVEEERRV